VTRHEITAHITVDIRHIESQAEGILDFVEGKSEELPELEDTSRAPGILERVRLAFLPVRTAYAAEMKAESPAIRALARDMRERHDEVEKLKDRKLVGENNRGYLEVRPAADELPAEEKNAVQKLVTEENEDRKALYMEIVRLNEDATLSIVEGVYADKRLERARPGEVFQLPPPGKRFEDFEETRLAQRLGDAAKPGAWVTIK
jgi:uncharacterized protein YdbL (DUF1318 family)